jgi:Mg-chelatase subunit ChlD
LGAAKLREKDPRMTTLTAETASEYDFIVGLDASGSMASPSKRRPGKTRWQEAQETILGIAASLEPFDADGIDVVVFGGTASIEEGVTSAKVADLFAKRSPRGSTPLAEALSLIVGKQKKTGKNTVAIVFTDGEPDDRAAAEKVIVDASNGLEKDEALTFLFVQIGDDAGAAAYLTHLDDGLSGAKFDIVDAMTAAEADQFEPIDLINKAIND